MRIFIFTFRKMLVGGIETEIAAMAKECLARNYRVVFLRQEGENARIDESFQDLLSRVETVDLSFRDRSWKKVHIDAAPEDEIVMYTANILDYVHLDALRKRHPELNIQLIYWIPHFTGKAVFIEDFFPGKLRKGVRGFLRKMYCFMDRNKSINYGNPTHYEAFIKKYGYEIGCPPAEKILSGNVENFVFDEEAARERYRCDEFCIISVSRFDFPHKAFILGLIRHVDALMKNYPQLRLHIIGYGADEARVREVLEKSENYKNGKIVLEGKVAPDLLADRIRQAQLNIGVAGTIRTGSLCGVISLPVRHHSETCECYGFLPESRWKTLSSDPGENIDTYVEKVLHMSEDEYVTYARRSFDAYAVEENKIDGLFRWKNVDPHGYLPRRYFMFFATFEKIANMFPKLKKQDLAR